MGAVVVAVAHQTTPPPGMMGPYMGRGKHHYYRPDINEIITNRVRSVLDKIMKELIN